MKYESFVKTGHPYSSLKSGFGIRELNIVNNTERKKKHTNKVLRLIVLVNM